jgi:hypothetical protein
MAVADCDVHGSGLVEEVEHDEDWRKEEVVLEVVRLCMVMEMSPRASEWLKVAA